ncbi:MAG: hypothetical protein LAT81_05065 [Oceanicaulis sp.]|nr:hypothetical protein [Oceanicaulis sp.]
MRINKESVANSTFELTKSTTNKFWGVLAIISSIDEPIKPNKTYRLSSRFVMAFLDDLFSLGSISQQEYHEGTIYVKFSTNWKERLESLTLKSKPSLTSAAIFYCKNKSFDNNISSTQINDLFLNDCKIRANELDNLFGHKENESIMTGHYKTSDLVNVLESKFNISWKVGANLSLETPYFIQSRPSELKRAPFIQTLYSGDRIKELLLLSDTNLEELYPVADDRKLAINSGTTLKDFIDSLSKVNLIFDDLLVTRFYAALLTKPFVILSGLSGSGKTKLAQAFVQWICTHGPSNLSSIKFTNGEVLSSQRVTYKVTHADLYSVTFTQIDSNTKVTLPYELIYEWGAVIKNNNFDVSTPTRTIRELVGLSTNYSTQLNSFESHLKAAALELISRNNLNPQDSSQYLIIPVGADWTNREPLLGYPNALKPEEYVKPDSGVLDLIICANRRPDLPHFLILDEMNLSHVERYFADFLSVMESNEEIPLHTVGTVENGVPAKLKVPSNLFIIGTVNIDETTNMFSPKVLDRANTIEFRVTPDDMKDFLDNIKDIHMDSLTGKGAGMAKSFLDMAANKSFVDDETVKLALVGFFGELKKAGAEFGYRTATEILRLINQLTVLDNELSTEGKIDIAIMQKLLPKLHGSRRKLCPVLETLGQFCISSEVKIVNDVFEKDDFDFNGANVIYPLSLEKIARMYKSALDNGFTSFAEA